ncbi:MAG: hypothetical protein ACOCXJ_06505 [Planctomycetota bacterium]
MDLDIYLDDLERRIDPDQELDLEQRWCAFAHGRCPEPLFIPQRSPVAPRIDWPSVPIDDTLDDLDLNILRELSHCSRELEHGGGLLLHLRANYGVGILPTAFGAEEYRMPREQDTLPNVRALGPERIPALLAGGQPPVDAGRLADVWRWAGRMDELLDGRPLLSRHLHRYHPDLQGPMDVCELLWGSDIFYDLYDEPERVQALLDLICDTYETVMDRWLAWEPGALPAGYTCHWGLVHGGRIMLRDDSAMNLSPTMFGDFIAPWDARLLERYGGAVHFCGRGDHYIEQLAALPGLRAVNMSQPQLNDLDRILDHTVRNRLPLLGLDHHAAPALPADLPVGMVHMHRCPEESHVSSRA